MTAHASSTALVEIERPGRWGKQLASHLGRRHGGEWSEESASGWVDFDGARAALAAEGGGLRLVVEAPAEELDRYEGVVGRHLVRFARDLAPVVAWERADGTAGTRQTIADLEDDAGR